MYDANHTYFAQSFANDWISSWNSHDIDKILSHYSDNFTIETRIAARVVPASNGRVVGKEAVREYLRPENKLPFEL